MILPSIRVGRYLAILIAYGFQPNEGVYVLAGLAEVPKEAPRA